MLAKIQKNGSIVIDHDNKTYCQSFDQIIAIKDIDGISLSRLYWDISKTTGRHRTDFLNESFEKTREKLLNGVYKTF